MKTIRNFILIAAMSVAACWAAQRVLVHQVQLMGPMGSDTGHLIATDNNLIFVDDVNPNNSFTIPKPDITALNYTNDVMTISMAHPFTDIYGNRSDTVLRFQNPRDASMIADWAGLPMTSAEVTVGRSRAESYPVTANQYDVIHDDDHGRLIIGANQIEWQDLKNTSKSHTWAYGDIKEFKRENSNELKLKTYSGDSFKFKTQGPAMTDDVYNQIADRIVAAHH